MLLLLLLHFKPLQMVKIQDKVRINERKNNDKQRIKKKLAYSAPTNLVIQT